jgi:hypothetical protein
MNKNILIFKAYLEYFQRNFYYLILQNGKKSAKTWNSLMFANVSVMGWEPMQGSELTIKLT